MSRILTCTEPVYAKPLARGWYRSGKIIRRKALWTTREKTNKFFDKMPCKVKMANQVHQMYDHEGSDAPHWRRAWVRLQTHMTWFEFQTNWF